MVFCQEKACGPAAKTQDNKQLTEIQWWIFWLTDWQLHQWQWNWTDWNLTLGWVKKQKKPKLLISLVQNALKKAFSLTRGRKAPGNEEAAMLCRYTRAVHQSCTQSLYRVDVEQNSPFLKTRPCTPRHFRWWIDLPIYYPPTPSIIPLTHMPRSIFFTIVLAMEVSHVLLFMHSFTHVLIQWVLLRA